MTALVAQRPPSFGEVVAARHRQGELVVQPRMGFADPARMREGLLATRAASAATVGTITMDSFTRVGDHHAVPLVSTAVQPSAFRRGLFELQLPVDADALWQQAWLVVSNGI